MILIEIIGGLFFLFEFANFGVVNVVLIRLVLFSLCNIYIDCIRVENLRVFRE